MSTITRVTTPKVDLPYERIADFCRRWKIVKLELFGSALREDFGPESDLDFLYTAAPDARWGWEIVTLANELEALVGRPVDLVSRGAVEKSENRIRRREFLGTAKVVYEQ
jgi:hypothetical protein